MNLPYRTIGMVHLPPLPLSPGYKGSVEEILERALMDAEALQEAGFDAVLIENYGDLPFHKDDVEPVVVAMMTRVICDLMTAIRIPIGVQVLRNDAISALSIAAATGCEFIRVNVHTAAALTDQGMIQGQADETLRLREQLRIETRILADVRVKHSYQFGDIGLEDAASDAVYRGLADGIIITGRATGTHASIDDVKRAKNVVDVPVLVGSGVTVQNAREYFAAADAIIIGTSLKLNAKTTNPVDPDRAKAFMESIR